MNLMNSSLTLPIPAKISKIFESAINFSLNIEIIANLTLDVVGLIKSILFILIM